MYCVIVVASVNVPAASSYVEVMPVPAVTKALTLSSTLSLVKYKLSVPSLIFCVVKVNVPPKAKVFEFIVTLELARELFGILDKAKSM